MNCTCCGQELKPHVLYCENCLVYVGDDVPKQSPLKAIKQYCYECSGESRSEVKRCSSRNCPLKPFRMGKNPFTKKRELTDEQRAIMAERLRKNLNV